MATNKDFIVKNGLSVGEDISVSGSVTSNLQFDDNIEAQFGNNSDLQIYSDNTYSYIQESSTQGLRITSDNAVAIRKHDDENIALFNVDGAVRLYHDSLEKFSTSSTGINVTGNAVLTGELRGPASFVIDPAAVGDNTGEVVIKGDLTVEGTQTTVNSTTLDVADKNITLNHGSGDTSATADQAGITIQDAVSSGNDATILWTTSNDRFNFSHPVSVTGDIIGSSSLQIVRSAAGAASVLLQRNGAAGSWSLAQGHTATDYFEILEGSNTRMTIANGGATTFPGNLTSNGTITGADYSGITMGGSLSGSHDDAKVQYGTSFSGTPAQGHFFFDSLNQKLKVYTGSAFVDAVPAGGGGGGGSGSSDATATFRKYTYTLTGTTNAISGKEDDEVTTGDFISGRLYEITAVGDTDFTLIGASSNAIGVQFTATDVGGGSTGKAKEVLFYATGGTQNIEVYVNGVKAVEGSSNDYVATTGTSVTFTSNLSSGDVVDIQVYELLTNDSYYLKTETYTQAQTIAGFVAKSGDTMTGNLTVEKGANPTLTVTETSAGAVTIQGTGSGGRVYSNANHKLLLGAGGQNAHLTIDTSGNVTTKGNTTFSNNGIELRGGNGGLRSIRSNAEPIILNRLGSDGKIVGIYYAGNEIGYLGSNTTGGNSLLDISSEDDDDSNIRFLTYGNSSHNEVMRLTSDRSVGIGTNNPVHNYAAGVTGISTKLAVLGTTAGTGFEEIAHFVAGGDSDDTGATVRIGHYGNDRGLYIKAGRGASNRAIAHFGLRESGNTDNDVMTLYQTGSDYRVGIGESTPFAKSHIKDTGWSTGAPYGTVQLIEGAAVNDNNWGHLVITDTDTAVGQGGAISFATGISTGLNPFSGIKGVAEGTSWGGIGFYSRPQSGTSTQRIILDSDGHFKPSADATYDLGSSTLAWRNVYTNDLHLSNEGQEEGNSVDGTKGNWTIQEGEEHLYIINNKSGKKYKFALEEIE